MDLSKIYRHILFEAGVFHVPRPIIFGINVEFLGLGI